MTNHKPDHATAERPLDALFVAIAGLLVTALAFVMAESSGSDVVPRWPYVWRGIAVTYFLCALPAARWLETLVAKQVNELVASSVAVVALASVWFGTMSLSNDSPLRDASPLTLNAIRACLALVVATAAMILSRNLRSLACRNFKPPARDSAKEFNRPSVPAMLGLLFAAFVPAAFLESRQDDARTKLVEYLAQSRLGAARRLAAQLRVLAPDERFGKATIQQIAVELDERVSQIERQVASPLSPTAAIPLRLERARLYALLGRVKEAQKTLQPLISTDPPHVSACVLLGTAYEWAEDWPTSLRWYTTARDGLMPHSQSPTTRPLLLQATKGIAFTQRKLGRLREAEAAYQHALSLSPTADMHFLLAQFYEDAQLSSQAQQHVRKAMELDREHYDSPGRDLLDKLQTHHFGCLSVYHSSAASE